MFDIEEVIYDYICRANSKIAEISREANDLLSKTGCNCDISAYLDDITDINSSLFIINKGWENIEETFGYKNYLIKLFPSEDFDAASAVLEVIQTYIDRYSMGAGASIVTPLLPSVKLGASCCSGFIDNLYYNKTDSDLRYYPIDRNPAGYLTEETDPTVPSHVKAITQEDIDSWGAKLTSETDPTVPSHVKAISLSDISSWDNKLSVELDPTVPSHVKAITTVNIGYWNSKLDEESDPTVPSYVKAITEADIDYWNDKITTETDPTVPSFVKAITSGNISNWNSAYNTTLTLSPLFIPRSSFTTLSFNRIGGYIIGTQAQPLTSTNINVSIGGDIAFSRSVIFHQAASKPTFTGTGITVTEIGSYNPSQVNEMLLFYNGSGRVVVIYSGEVETLDKSLVTRGTISATSNTAVNISGFEWEIDGTLYASGTVTGIPVTTLPSSGIRVDSFWGNSSGAVIYVQGSDSLNEFFTEYPDRVLLSTFIRKAVGYSHPVYTPINVLANTGFVISEISTDSIGSIIAVNTRALSKVDVGLGNVDNTSDLNKPVSTATQAVIDALDDRFLRKDQNDSNSTFKLSLGALDVSGIVNFTGLTEDLNPVNSIGLSATGQVVKYTAVTIDDIINLQDQIDLLELVEGDKNHSHIQAVAADTWTVTHGLGKRPAINVYDSDGNTVQYAVDFPDLNTVILSFIGEISGRADFN